MSGFKLGKDALIFSIMTLITVLTWISVEVYLTATKSTIPKVTQEQMIPLNPVIKKEAIEKIKTDFWFSEEELGSFQVVTSTESAAKEK